MTDKLRDAIVQYAMAWLSEETHSSPLTRRLSTYRMWPLVVKRYRPYPPSRPARLPVPIRVI